MFFSKALESATLIDRGDRQDGLIFLLVSWKDYEGACKAPFPSSGGMIFQLDTKYTSKAIFE